MYVFAKWSTSRRKFFVERIICKRRNSILMLIYQFEYQAYVSFTMRQSTGNRA